MNRYSSKGSSFKDLTNENVTLFGTYKTIVRQKLDFLFLSEYFLLTSQSKQRVNSDKLHFGC